MCIVQTGSEITDVFTHLALHDGAGDMCVEVTIILCGSQEKRSGPTVSQDFICTLRCLSPEELCPLLARVPGDRSKTKLLNVL